MRAAFDMVLGMSVAGSWVIGFVLAARVLLRKAPARFRYLLWGLVLLRLLCPVTLESPASLLPERAPIVVNAIRVPDERPSVASPQPGPTVTVDAEPYADIPVEGVSSAAQESVPFSWALFLRAALRTLRAVWLPGMALLLGYCVLSFVRLKRRLVGAVHLRDNIWLADHIDTAFVFGVLRPRIYLPSALPVEEQGYILLHEQTHLRRRDPLWKLLGFAALAVHWFNPLVWAAVRCAGRDMELSCDEAVLAQLGSGIRQQYAASLLRLSSPHQPGVAFGEGSTKARILNVLHYKNPKLIATLAGATAVILLACGLLTDPVKDVGFDSLAGSYAVTECMSRWYPSSEFFSADSLPAHRQYLISGGAGNVDGYTVDRAGLFRLLEGDLQSPYFWGEPVESDMGEDEFAALFGFETSMDEADARRLYRENRKLWRIETAGDFRLLMLQNDGSLYLFIGRMSAKVSADEVAPQVTWGWRLVRDGDAAETINPGIYAVKEIWYEALGYNFGYTLDTVPRYTVNDTGTVTVSGNMVGESGFGRLEEIRPGEGEKLLTKQNFDNNFRNPDEITHMSVEEIREQAERVWLVESGNEYLRFIRLREQPDGSKPLLLANGYTDSNIRWLFRLEEITADFERVTPTGDYRLMKTVYNALHNSGEPDLANMPGYSVYMREDGNAPELCEEIIGEDAMHILGSMYPIEPSPGNFDALFPDSGTGWSGMPGTEMSAQVLREENDGAWLLCTDDCFYIMLSNGGMFTYLVEGTARDGEPLLASHVYLLGWKPEKQRISDEARRIYNQLLAHSTPGYEEMTVAEFNRQIAPDIDAEVKLLEDYAAISGEVPEDDPNADFFYVTLQASCTEIYAKNLHDDCSYIFNIRDQRGLVEPLSEEEIFLLAISPVYRFNFGATIYVTYELEPGVTVGERDHVLQTLRSRLKERVQSAPEDVLRREAGTVLHSWAKEILSETPHDGMLVTFSVATETQDEDSDGEITDYVGN